MSEYSYTRVRTALSACFVTSRVIFVALFALCLSTPVLRAQDSSASVTGRISNAVTGSYLNNARVTAVGTGKTVFTNSYGEYRIAGLPEGEVTLEVFYTGLDTKTVSVSVLAGRTASQNVALSNAALTGDVDDDTVVLDEFIVQATEQANDAVAINEQRFSTNIKNVVSSDAFGDVTEGNPGEFLKYLPGISVDYVAADVRSVSVRGFGSAFTSVNVDGNRMASAASSGTSRSFELEQVSMNNVARLEVVKVPTPSMPADSLGGSVNLVSKNAFERDKAEFKYRAYTSISDEDLTLGKTPGPSVEKSRKIRPGFDFSYSNPLNSSFGFILNGLHSDQFNEQHRSRTSWQNSGGGASTADPYMRTYTVQDGPKETRRDSIGLNMDWKVSERGVLSFGYQWNDYDSFFGNRNYNINAGSNVPAGSYDGTFTQGRSKAGEVTGGMSFREKFGTTNHANLNFKYYGDNLEVNAGGYYSYATNKYRDADNGHFSGVNTRVRNLTIRHDNINSINPPDMTIVDGSGNPVDWTQLSNYNLRSVRSQQQDSWDEFIGGNIDVTKSFDGLARPFELKFGVNMRQQERDIIRRQDDYNYLGPDGKAESSDDNAAPFLDTIYVNQDPHWGLPAPQYADPYKVYAHFLAHPEYFSANVNNWQNRAQNDYNLVEKISAAYVQGDMDFLEGRMKLLGGVRYERTDVDGIGFLYNPDGHLDANGNPISDDPYTQKRLQYQRRAATSSRDYDGFYPSAHLVYNLQDNLILRLAYARTIGRPDFANILPGTVIDPDDTAPAGEPGGDITVRNTGLLPYTGDNFDLSLEYYFGSSNVLSLGVFHKDITDFFGTIDTIVDEQDLLDYDLDNEYLGYRLTTTINSGDAKISGWEFNYSQKFDGLTGIWKNFGVFANGTFLDLDGGNNANFSGFIKKTGNWGINYFGQRFNAKIKWNYRGKQFRSFQSAFGTGGAEYYDPRLYLDVNFDYQITKNVTAFINARNILNEQQLLVRYGDDTPTYARDYQAEEFGVQYAIGIKGKF